LEYEKGRLSLWISSIHHRAMDGEGTGTWIWEHSHTLITRIKAEGKSIWIYGASTKGNTILQYCGLGNMEIDAAADSNAFKIGKYIIGSDIPIKDEKTMREARPDYLLALPYSFVDGFMKREAELIARGTKFIVPLPDVKVIGD